MVVFDRYSTPIEPIVLEAPAREPFPGRDLLIATAAVLVISGLALFFWAMILRYYLA